MKPSFGEELIWVGEHGCVAMAAVSLGGDGGSAWEDVTVDVGTPGWDLAGC